MLRRTKIQPVPELSDSHVVVMETLYENKMAGVKGKSMRIFVRTRPSVSFSEKSIQIHDDKQVRYYNDVFVLQTMLNRM